MWRVSPLFISSFGRRASGPERTILLCDLHGPGHEGRIADALRFHVPYAQPNRLMIRHADHLLARNGRMIMAIESMRPAAPAWEGQIVQLPISLDEL